MASRPVLGIAVLLFATAGSAMAADTLAGNPDKVKLVEAGKLTEARADWWGFDPADSTRQLQAAIDYGAKKLVIPKMVSADPDDDKFVATAVAGHADAIVTNDRHLLVLDPYQTIRVLRPTTFLDQMAGDVGSDDVVE